MKIVANEKKLMRVLLLVGCGHACPTVGVSDLPEVFLYNMMCTDRL